MAPIRVLHVVPKLVSDSFDPQRSPTCDAYVDDEIVAIRRWRGDVFEWREDGRPGVEPRGDGQDAVVSDRETEGGYADLAVDGVRGRDWDGWWRISWIVVRYLVRWDFNVYDGVVEGLDCEPGGVDGVTGEWTEAGSEDKVRTRLGHARW